MTPFFILAAIMVLVVPAIAAFAMAVRAVDDAAKPLCGDWRISVTDNPFDDNPLVYRIRQIAGEWVQYEYRSLHGTHFNIGSERLESLLRRTAPFTMEGKDGNEVTTQG